MTPIIFALLAIAAKPPEVEVTPMLGEQVPLELEFSDEAGAAVSLKKYFREKPVIVALAYYECPMLCSLVQNGLARGLRPLALQAGTDFEVVVVSIDPTESPQLAAQKKKMFPAWNFLTGTEENIASLARAIGLGYVYQKEIDQYAHAAAVTVLTPDGRVARYLYGIDYAPRDLKLALVEATERKIATAVDVLLLLCFHYDPIAGKYGLAIMNGLRGASVLTVLGIGGAIGMMLRRERKRARARTERAG